MALKKDNLPVNVDVDTEQGSSITYANEVVAIIAGVAASEVEGIAGMCNVSGNLLGKNRAVTKGVKVEIPLQSYFRLNAPGAGQFEHTLIIVDEGASLHFIEGCSHFL